jgi:chemotaxis protein methyltransferase CheR
MMIKTEQEVYKFFCQAAQEACGIQLGEKQIRLVETRLQKRWRELGLPSIVDYFQYYLKNVEVEKQQIISLLTTHHTYFFREFAHFEFLLERLPDLVKTLREEKRNTLKIWSAASSRGEEAYSLAMFLTYHLKTLAPDIKISIFGSDVCVESVQRAKNGVYTWEDLKKSPRNYIDGKWLKGTGEIEGYVSAKKELRDICSFSVMNLFEITKNSFREKFDIIFCRNVFIYFNPTQIKDVTQRLMEHLTPKGYFFIGLSESLLHMDMVDVGHLGKSIYHKGHIKAPKAVTKLKKVVCVDDSDVVLKLLRRIFNAENGYEVVGEARNGEEAHRAIQMHSPDYVTLDIHMPVLDGVSYLEKYYNESHPSVLIVSSVSRDERDLALKALNFGARDYVEKPSLANFAKAQEEILSKLAAMPITKSTRKVMDIEGSFSKDLLDKKLSNEMVAVISDGSDLTLVNALSKACPNVKNFERPKPGFENLLFSQIIQHLAQGNGKKYLFIQGEIPYSYDTHLKSLKNLSMLFIEDHQLVVRNKTHDFSYNIDICPRTSMDYEFKKVA